MGFAVSFPSHIRGPLLTMTLPSTGNKFLGKAIGESTLATTELIRRNPPSTRAQNPFLSANPS